MMNKSKPRWFNGPIKPKYVDIGPTNFLNKPTEKIIKPKIPWITYNGKSNKFFKLESLLQLHCEIKPKIYKITNDKVNDDN